MRLSREGQTHSAKNAKPLLTTIHPFLVTLGEPALVREVRTQHFHFCSRQTNVAFLWKCRTSLQLAEQRRVRLLLEFFLPRSAYVGNKPWIRSLVVLVIAASLAEAEVAVDCSADHICIPVVLPVILPPAHLA